MILKKKKHEFLTAIENQVKQWWSQSDKSAMSVWW
jgi:hypothetical protein